MKYKTLLEDLLNSFKVRFKDLRTLDTEWKIFHDPFYCNVISAPSELLLELIDLQNSIPLRTLGLTGTELYRILPKERFAKLRDYAIRVIALFGSTYCMCANSFF